MEAINVKYSAFKLVLKGTISKYFSLESDKCFFSNTMHMYILINMQRIVNRFFPYYENELFKNIFIPFDNKK